MKFVEWKIEKGLPEREDLVMGNDRLTKVVVLGWWQALEARDEMVKRRLPVL